jgi:hypothetical protein
MRPWILWGVRGRLCRRLAFVLERLLRRGFGRRAGCGFLRPGGRGVSAAAYPGPGRPRPAQAGGGRGGFDVLLVQHAGVGIGGQHDTGVPELLLHRLQISPRAVRQTGRAVPQVMQPHRRQAGVLHEAAEPWRFPGFVGGCGSVAASIARTRTAGSCPASSTQDKIMYGAARKTWELSPTAPGNTAGPAACPSSSRHRELGVAAGVTERDSSRDTGRRGPRLLLLGILAG